MPYLPGSLISNRYEVASRPLLGGMGIVYLCLDHQTGQPVALKTFKPEYLPNREARDHFLQEGTAWVQFGKHPNIVQCYEVDRSDNGLEVYLVLELIARPADRANASLRSWLIPDMPLSAEQVLLFALQVARGMQHACACLPGFVHRDLKPENLLVGADTMPGWEVNRLRITDFGLVGLLAGKGAVIPENVGSASSNLLHYTTRIKGVAGTPRYMAPEQWQEQALCPQTDIFSLGCILGEMLCGESMIPGDDLETLQRNCSSGILHPLPQGLPEPLSACVRKCLAIDPNQRYSQWEQLITDLQAIYAELSGKSIPQQAAPEELIRAERVRKGWAYNNIGLSYLDIGRTESAFRYFGEVSGIGQNEHERILEMAGINNQGLAFIEFGNAQQSINFFEQALSIAREIKNRRGEGNSLGNLGIAYKELAEAQKAISYHKQALVISREIGDRQAEINDLRNLGNAYSNLGDAKRAVGYFEEALKISYQIGDRHAEASALGNLGVAYMGLGDLKRSIDYLSKQLLISREIGDRRGEGGSLGNLGIVYNLMGDIRKAITYHEQRLVIAREVGNKREEGRALGELGISYTDLGDFNRAIGYYEQQLVINRNVGDRRAEGNALGNTGMAYAGLGDHRRAISYYEQALEIRRAIGDRQGEGNDLGNLGGSYGQLGETRKALDYIKQAQVIHRETGNLTGLADTSFNSALLYAMEGDIASAQALAQQAADLFSQVGNQHKAQIAYQLLAQLQSEGSKGNLDPAEAAFIEFVNADSPQAMQAALKHHPLLEEERYQQTIEQAINMLVVEDQKAEYKQRLTWLRDLTHSKRPGLFGRLFGRKE